MTDLYILAEVFRTLLFMIPVKSEAITQKVGHDFKHFKLLLSSCHSCTFQWKISGKHGNLRQGGKISAKVH